MRFNFVAAAISLATATVTHVQAIDCTKDRMGNDLRQISVNSQCYWRCTDNYQCSNEELGVRCARAVADEGRFYDVCLYECPKRTLKFDKGIRFRQVDYARRDYHSACFERSEQCQPGWDCCEKIDSCK